jgi:hypothetical protein
MEQIPNEENKVHNALHADEQAIALDHEHPEGIIPEKDHGHLVVLHSNVAGEQAESMVLDPPK